MELLTEGIASAKILPRQEVSKYRQPSRILKIWMAKQKLAEKHEIAEKLAVAMHCSKKKAYQEMAYLQFALPKELSTF